MTHKPSTNRVEPNDATSVAASICEQPHASPLPTHVAPSATNHPPFSNVAFGMSLVCSWDYLSSVIGGEAYMFYVGNMGTLGQSVLASFKAKMISTTP